LDRLKVKLVAVITGGNSGIGLSAAKAFVDEDANFVIFGRNQKTVDAALETLGERPIAVKGDVTNDSDLDNLYAPTKLSFGKVDVVFANAGISELLPLEQITNDHFDNVFAANVKGALKTVQGSLDSLNDIASIILKKSGVAQAGLSGGKAVYSATKAAVRSFAHTFSRDLLVPTQSLSRFLTTWVWLRKSRKVWKVNWLRWCSATFRRAERSGERGCVLGF